MLAGISEGDWAVTVDVFRGCCSRCGKLVRNPACEPTLPLALIRNCLLILRVLDGAGKAEFGDLADEAIGLLLG